MSIRRFVLGIYLVGFCGCLFSAEPQFNRQRIGEDGVTGSYPFQFLMLPRGLAFEVAGCLSAEALTNLRATCRGLHEGLVGEGVPRDLRRRAILPRLVSILSIKDKQEALVGAVITGDAELARLLLLNGADPFVSGVVSFYEGLEYPMVANRLRAIEWAAIYGSVKVVKEIIAYESRLLLGLNSKFLEGTLPEDSRGKIQIEVDKKRTFSSLTQGPFLLLLRRIVVVNLEHPGISEEMKERYREILVVVKEGRDRLNAVREAFERARLWKIPPASLRRQNAVIGIDDAMLYPGAIVPMRKVGGALRSIRSLDELLGGAVCPDVADVAAAAVGDSEDV